jgi:hypothetical protein
MTVFKVINTESGWRCAGRKGILSGEILHSGMRFLTAVLSELTINGTIIALLDTLNENGNFSYSQADEK